MVHAQPAPRARPDLVRLAVWFAAGFLSVLVFHQGMVALLHATGAVSNAPFSMRPTRPLGIPQMWSLAFWGGVWAIALSWVEPRFPRGAAYWVLGLLFGAIGPSLVAWFVVLPLKGGAVAAGWHVSRLAVGLAVNGAWGLGCVLLFRLAGTALPGIAMTAGRRETR